MATTNEILTRLVADTRQFNGAMNGTIKVMERFNKKGEVIGQSVQVMTKHMKDGAGKTAGLGKAMTALSRDIKVAGTIFNTLESSIVSTYQAASEGAKILAAEEFFKNSGKSIESYRQATNGMLSDAELMKKANLADSMGIDEETFKKLTVVAEASALKTGQSFDHMFNSIITGTARSSRLLLDNLGIIVSVGQANEKYAASIGKTVGELSAQEKQIAFVNEVALKSQGTLDEFANVADKNAISFSRFDAVLQNLVDVIKVNLAQALGEVLPGFTTFFQNVLDLAREKDWGSIGAYIAYSLGEGLNTTLAALAPEPGLASLFKGFAKNSKAAAEGVFVSAQNEKSNKVTTQEDQLLSLLRTARPNMGGMQMADREAKLQYFADFSKKQIETLKEVDPHWAGLIEAIQETAKNLKLLPKPTPPPVAGGAENKKVGGAGGAPKEKAFGASKFKELMKGLDDIIANDFGKKGIGLIAPMLTSEFRKTLDAGEKGIDRQKKRIEEINELLSEEAKLRREAINQAAGDATTSIMTGQGLIAPLMEALTAGGGGVAKSVGSAISSLISGTAEGAAGGPMGSIIGAVVAVLMQLLDQLKPIMDIIDAIMAGLELFIKNGLGEFLAILSSLASPIRNLLAAIGLLVGSFLRPFVYVLAGAVAVVAAVVDAIALVIAVLSPFVEMFVWLITTIFTFGFSLISLFINMDEAVFWLMDSLDFLSRFMVNAVIFINNAIVNFARNILRMKGFGKILDKEDFKKSPIDENTNAVNANTQAVRDLTREFRNLPSGYKAEGAIYASQASEYGRMRRDAIGLASSVGLNNSRWRT